MDHGYELGHYTYMTLHTLHDKGAACEFSTMTGGRAVDKPFTATISR